MTHTDYPLRREQTDREPHDIAVNSDCQSQVCGQAVLRDIRAIDESTLDHIPTHQPLASTQYQQRKKVWFEPRVNFPHPEKSHQGEEKEQADETPQHSVQVLEPKNLLKFVERHSCVNQLVLGEQLVLLKEVNPIGRR